MISTFLLNITANTVNLIADIAESGVKTPRINKIKSYFAENKFLAAIINISLNSISDDVKYKLLLLHNGKSFTKLVTMASLSSLTDVQYNSVGILGQLSLVCKY